MDDQTENEPNTTENKRKQTSNNQKGKQIAKKLRLEGLIRISVHFNGAFTDPEMDRILRNLKVRETRHMDPNKKLVVGLAKMGSLYNTDTSITIDHTQQYQGLLSEIDHSTQVNEREIDEIYNTLEIAHNQSQIEIPKLIENPTFTSTTPKPQEIFFNQKSFINYSNLDIPENIAILLSFGPKFSIPIYYDDKDFSLLMEAAENIMKIFMCPDHIEDVREDIRNRIKNFQKEQFHTHSSEVKDYFH